MFGAAPVCCFSCNLLVKLLLEMTNCKLNSYHISAALAFRVSVVYRGRRVENTHINTGRRGSHGRLIHHENCKMLHEVTVLHTWHPKKWNLQGGRRQRLSDIGILCQYFYLRITKVWYNHFDLFFFTHWSATRLKPLTGKVNNIDHLVTVQCSAEKPLVLVFIWTPFDVHHPPEHG